MEEGRRRQKAERREGRRGGGRGRKGLSRFEKNSGCAPDLSCFHYVALFSF